MRWDDAMEAVADRSTAAGGLDASADGRKFHDLVVTPVDMARKLLFGYLDGAELDRAVESLSAATTNTLVAMSLAMEDPRGGDPRASLYVALTQMLLMGMLVGGGPHDNDRPERYSSGDFEGADE